MCTEDPLVALDFTVGGVRVFDIGTSLGEGHCRLPEAFLPDFPELATIKKLEEGILDQEHFGVRSTKYKIHDIEIERLILSSEISVKVFSAELFVSLFPSGICSLCLKVDIKQALTTDNIIEIVGILTSGKMRENRNVEPKLLVKFNNVAYQSFGDMFDRIETLLLASISGARNTRYTNTFMCPVIFIKSCKGQEQTAEELVVKYKRQLAGMKHLWIKKWRHLKDRLVSDDVRTESHPLNYGLTYFSPICTMEIHPTLVKDAAIIGERSVIEHYFVEWYLLSKVLEVVSCQYFMLRKYDFRLLQIQEEVLRRQPRLTLRAVLGVTRMIRRITRERQEVLLDIHDYWNIKISKRTYVQQEFEEAKKTFLLDNLFASINQRIASLDDVLNNLYQRVMAATNLVIAAIVVLLTVLTLVSQLRSANSAEAAARNAPAAPTPPISHDRAPRPPSSASREAGAPLSMGAGGWAEDSKDGHRDSQAGTNAANTP